MKSECLPAGTLKQTRPHFNWRECYVKRFQYGFDAAADAWNHPTRPRWLCEAQAERFARAANFWFGKAADA